tara:strand:+ start:997 stop:1401 length:405 start_codon:yes stop_codon:yes gene_type:complete
MKQSRYHRRNRQNMSSYGYGYSGTGVMSAGYFQDMFRIFKTFFFIAIVFAIILSRQMLLKDNANFLNLSLFIIIITILLTVLAYMDKFIYNNVIVGIAIAVGFLLLHELKVDFTSLIPTAPGTAPGAAPAAVAR